MGVMVASGWGVGLLLLLRDSVFKELGSGIAGEGVEEGSSAMERACVRERSVVAMMFYPLLNFLLCSVCVP